MVWDADNDTLDAHMRAAEGGIELVVAARGASYPVTIDPVLSTLAAARVGSDQANAHFGASVASALRIDDDGLSDVVVGAPQYDNQGADTGSYGVVELNGSTLTPLFPGRWINTITPAAETGFALRFLGRGSRRCRRGRFRRRGRGRAAL